MNLCTLRIQRGSVRGSALSCDACVDVTNPGVAGLPLGTLQLKASGAVPSLIVLLPL